jgi:leader peptidase (prepilin peptidase)/N-methyltransferase
MWLLIQQYPPLWLGICLVLGLLVGSFLNVVILRLPPLLEYEWQVQSRTLLNLDTALEPPPPGLVWDRSHCPHCDHQISAWENIPVLSYLLLRGRCRSCKQAISWRYPLIEILTALVTVIVAYRFGPSSEAIGGFLLSWIFIVLAAIDLDEQLLPDIITLPSLWMGMIFSLIGNFSDPTSSIVGAAAGYLSLWSIYQGFKLLTGKEGMGYGDFKLLALIGAWLGWQALPGTILMASLVGTCVGIVLLANRRQHQGQPMPFGPYLAVAGWLMLLFGDVINGTYLRLSGLT